MRYRYHTALPDAEGNRVLMLRQDSGWTLPYNEPDAFTSGKKSATSTHA